MAFRLLRGSLNLLGVGQLPGSVEVTFERTVETEVGKPGLAAADLFSAS